MKEYCRKDWMVPNKIQESADLLYAATCKYVEREEPSFEDWKEAFPHIWEECKESAFLAMVEISMYRFDRPDYPMKKDFWDYVCLIHSRSRTPICAVYLLFSKDGKVAKIGSSENLVQRMDCYSADSDFRDSAHGRGQAYYYICSAKERYFLEDVLRAEVGQMEGFLQAHRTDMFYCSKKVEFGEVKQIDLMIKLSFAQDFLKQHPKCDNIFEKWALQGR